MRGAAAVLLAAVVSAAAASAKVGAPGSAPVTIETRDDGWLIHRPSGLVLPRDVNGPSHTHVASLTRLDAEGAVVVYGSITLTVSQPALAADPLMHPPGMTLDPKPPILPSLLFWGAAAQPQTISFLHDGQGDGLDWLSFTLVVQGWQIEFAASYPPEARQTVIKTAEAVWANLASGNESEPR